MKAAQDCKLATVVLVEDNFPDIAYIKALLKHQQVKVNLYVCRDGQEALDYLQKKGKFNTAKRPDLILLDLNLPKVNGFQVLKIAQNDPLLKSIPIGISSGSKFEKDPMCTSQQGARFYMPKPFKINDFLANIGKLENIEIRNKDGSIVICQL